ncbi:MAG: hypothetical protein EBW87_01000 [Burkholderiaceae bacterium]|nr:hypothetical protein [Burkholderiaceae bacterium]
MLVNVKTDKTEYKTDIDKAWVWVKLEELTGLTLTDAQNKMADGSTKIITTAIWIATDTDEPFDSWVKSLIEFEVIDNDPKADTTAQDSN